MSNRNILMSAGMLGFVAVILGAFGAHALKANLEPGALESYTTGVRYQAWHSIALLAISFSPENFPLKKRVFQCWLIGIILFSGSIYLLSLDALMNTDLSVLGPVTPIGGLFLILGWFLIFWGSFRYSDYR